MTAESIATDADGAGSFGQGVVGTIKPIDGAVPPDGWLLCDGSHQLIEQHEPLFAVIGARFGGDGKTTFALPDLDGDHHFAICATGLYPKQGVALAHLKHASEESEYIAFQAQVRKQAAAQAPVAAIPVQHSEELDPEWLQWQCQAMMDAYARGDDPLQKFEPESELDPEIRRRHAEVLTAAYERGHDPFNCHPHVDDLDPEFLKMQAQSVMDAIARGEDPLHRHLHESELDPEWVKMQAQSMIDAHERGVPPLVCLPAHDQLDPELLERQTQVMNDAYAQGLDPLAPLHTPVSDVDPEYIERQVKAMQEASAAGHDPLTTHSHVDDIDSAELEEKVRAMQEAYAKGKDPLAPPDEEGGKSGKGKTKKMTELLPREKYDAHIGEVFRIGLDDDTVVDFTLIEVSDAGPQTTKNAIEAGKPAPFSVMFRGPADPVLSQATYRLSHEALGALDLFLVPVGEDGEGIAYEAVFN